VNLSEYLLKHNWDFLLVNTRLRNANLQSRARELLNKKDTKKSSKSLSEDTDINSTLNRTLLPDYDGVVYTLDAKLIGNIGRYFNHSCSPNIAVQNVFVDVRIRQFSLFF
jgi:histone-lysine N-methyltransferase SETDB1